MPTPMPEQHRNPVESSSQELISPEPSLTLDPETFEYLQALTRYDPVCERQTEVGTVLAGHVYPNFPWGNLHAGFPLPDDVRRTSCYCIRVTTQDGDGKYLLSMFFVGREGRLLKAAGWSLDRREEVPVAVEPEVAILALAMEFPYLLS